jgi:hypothetical protein
VRASRVLGREARRGSRRCGGAGGAPLRGSSRRQSGNEEFQAALPGLCTSLGGLARGEASVSFSGAEFCNAAEVLPEFPAHDRLASLLSPVRLHRFGSAASDFL